MPYRRVGRSGLSLPAVSLGLWHNFGDDVPLEPQRAILRRAFDRGVTHFDLANNYGPPYGARRAQLRDASSREDFRPYRDELVISTKAGYDMWPGPYGGRRLAQVPAGLPRPVAAPAWAWTTSTSSTATAPTRTTPLEETMGALRHRGALGQGAVRRDLLLLRRAHRARRRTILRDLGTPLLIHQPSYSMLNRVDRGIGLLDTLGERAWAASPSRPLAQGMLTDKYLSGVPAGLTGVRPRASRSSPTLLTDDSSRARPRAERDRRGTRAVAGPDGAGLGAARPARHVGAGRAPRAWSSSRTAWAPSQNLGFTDDELAAIDKHAVDAGDQPLGRVQLQLTTRPLESCHPGRIWSGMMPLMEAATLGLGVEVVDPWRTTP